MVEYVVDTFREGWTRQHAAIRANYQRVLVEAALAGTSLAHRVLCIATDILLLRSPNFRGGSGAIQWGRGVSAGLFVDLKSWSAATIGSDRLGQK